MSFDEAEQSKRFFPMPITGKLLQTICDSSKPQSQAECLPQYQNSGNPVRRMSNYNRPWLTAMTGSQQKTALDPEARCAIENGWEWWTVLVHNPHLFWVWKPRIGVLWCIVHVYSLAVPLAGRDSRHGRVSFCTWMKRICFQLLPCVFSNFWVATSPI